MQISSTVKWALGSVGAGIAGFFVAGPIGAAVGAAGLFGGHFAYEKLHPSLDVSASMKGMSASVDLGANAQAMPQQAQLAQPAVDVAALQAAAVQAATTAATAAVQAQQAQQQGRRVVVVRQGYDPRDRRDPRFDPRYAPVRPAPWSDPNKPDPRADPSSAYYDPRFDPHSPSFDPRIDPRYRDGGNPPAVLDPVSAAALAMYTNPQPTTATANAVPVTAAPAATVHGDANPSKSTATPTVGDECEDGDRS